MNRPDHFSARPRQATRLRLAAAALLAALASPSFALTVYTAGPGGLIKQLADDFKQSTGIDVQVFQADTGKVMARLEAEASNPRADVVISASWDSAADLDRRGWLLPYTSPNAAHVPAAYKTPTYVAQGMSTLVLAWNPKSGTPKPSDWSDLKAAAYKDKVNMPDPSQSGTALELVAGLHGQMGDGAWALLADLRANGMAVAGANAQALNPVLQGAKAVVFGAVDYVVLGQQARGESIEVIFPESGTVIAPRPMMILKSSKAADDAKRFIDFVLSEAGQARVAATHLIPARTDVAGKRPGLADVRLFQPTGEAAKSPLTSAEALKRFSSALGRH